MKFYVKLLNKTGSRIGILSDLPSNPQKSYETPMYLTVTKGGSVPHLTQDIVNKHFMEDFPLCIPSQHFINHLDVLQLYNKGVSEFTALKSHPVCVTVQDPTKITPSGFNDKTSVSIFGATGRRKLCPVKYGSLIEVMKPDWYESLNDADTPEDCSLKRIEKSWKYSLQFLEKSLLIHEASKTLHCLGIFAPLIGGYNVTLREKWTDVVSELEVDGYTLLGLHQNGDSAEKLNFKKIQELTKASLAKLPDNRPVQASGAFNVVSVLKLVGNGVDIFDSSLPFMSAEKGRALCFPNTFDISQDETPANILDKREFQYETKKEIPKHNDSFLGAKKLKFDPEESSNGVLSNSDLHINDEDLGNYAIDLNDKRYFDSEGPLVPGCSCYACKTYNSSYIHHLLSVREMLASILLMLHNLHHWQTFFETIRKVIRADRLTDYTNFMILYQNKK